MISRIAAIICFCCCVTAFAQSGGDVEPKGRPPGPAPLQYEAVAGRLAAYPGREVEIEGKLTANTPYSGGSVLAIQVNRRLAYVQTTKEMIGLKLNAPISLTARIPRNGSGYLQFVAFANDENLAIELKMPALVKLDETGEAKMLELVNAEREKEKLKPLKFNDRLILAARRHSVDMASNDYFSHEGKNGSSVSKRVADEKVSYHKVGENIAGGESVQSCHRGLMESKGHRRNILDKEFTEIGIGIVKTPQGLIVTQVFIQPD